MKLSIGVALGVAAMLAVPAASSANPVTGLVNQVTTTVNNTVGGMLAGGGSQGGSRAAKPAPQAGTPPSYVPPAHGTNPHGQGTGAVLDLTPEQTTPLPYEEGGGDEEVVAGRSRGEQNSDGTYHGHITILALLGTELLGVDTEEGETDTGPLGDLNDALDDICTQSAGTLCLNILDINSSTDANGSQNSFELADASVGLQGAGVVSASAVSSEGDISDDGECQTSDGSSEVADASVLDEVTADVINSSSESTACNDGSSNVSQDSSAINAAGINLPSQDCEDGVPNTVGLNLLGLLSVVCNADDTSSGQLADPYGVREGLSVFLLPVLGDTPLALATTAASESQAVAPGTGEEEPPGGPPGGNKNDSAGGNEPAGGAGKGPGPAGGPGGPTAENKGGNLPFTGTDLLVLALIGLGVMGVGLGALALADRRHGPVLQATYPGRD